MLSSNDIELIKGIIKKAGDKLLASTPRIINHKSINDLLTKNDLEIESYIINALRASFSDIAIISEESAETEDDLKNSFVIDPIDGTCNYANGIPMYGIQMAYFENSICLFSIIYLPASNELYYAIRNKGAYLNDKRIYIAKKPHQDSILLISDYYNDQPIKMNTQFELVMALQNKFLKTRHLGAACIDFTSLVRGNAGAYITYYYHIWDIAPGLLLVAEAGGVYENLLNEGFSYFTKGIAVASTKEALEIIKKEFNKLK